MECSYSSFSDITINNLRLLHQYYQEYLINNDKKLLNKISEFICNLDFEGLSNLRSFVSYLQEDLWIDVECGIKTNDNLFKEYRYFEKIIFETQCSKINNKFKSNYSRSKKE